MLALAFAIYYKSGLSDDQGSARSNSAVTYKEVCAHIQVFPYNQAKQSVVEPDNDMRDDPWREVLLWLRLYSSY